LSEFKNINFYKTSIKYSKLKKSSQDFGYCLGVLHHLPDTYDGIKSCVELLKRSAPFLVYIYYNLENRPFLFRIIWNITNIL
jgi:2-polyprenyl-3-methyl-5-hydroxy-6-metoxy-1,4-benzoquinol methylase